VTDAARAKAARALGAEHEPVRTVVSAAVLLPRNDIDTDQIIPARFLKAVTRDGLGEELFADWRREPDGAPRPEFPLNQPGMAGRQILVAGLNFGCGSSREHAVWALSSAGFRVVIAGSFADIFRNNALKNGLLPVAVDHGRLASLHSLLEREPDVSLAVDLERQTLTLPDAEVAFEVDPFARRMLLDGTDELGYLLSLEPQVAAYERRHPARVSTRTA
jgi:3-isopropylmalate/(R)-2-methylmalate dehydratase small subunit